MGIIKHSVLAAAIGCAVSLSASPSLYFSDGLGHIIIVSGSGNSVNADGTTVGNWTVVSLRAHEEGSVSRPAFVLDTLDAVGRNGETLKVFLSDNYLGPTAGGASLAVGGNVGAGGSARLALYAQSNNALWSNPPGGDVVPWFTVNSGPFSVSTGGAVNAGYPYSMTESFFLTATNGPTTFSMTGRMAVPDGGRTLMLLGAALAGVGLISRRLR